jgi:hypothetical protein
MQIHQLQMSYSPEEDHIILRVVSSKSEEICLFLTRRLVNDFWTIFVSAMQRQSEPMLKDTLAVGWSDLLGGLNHVKNVLTTKLITPAKIKAFITSSLTNRLSKPAISSLASFALSAGTPAEIKASYVFDNIIDIFYSCLNQQI